MKDSTIVQEKTVNVTPKLTFSVDVAPPTGGWPVGGLTIVAQGLDMCNNPVSGDVDSVDIKIS